jgi:hypothetical protein
MQKPILTIIIFLILCPNEKKIKVHFKIFFKNVIIFIFLKEKNI